MGLRLPRNPLGALQHDLAISFLAIVSVGIGLYQLGRPRVARFTVLDVVDLVIVLVFIVDFTARARASGDWRTYTRQRWWELPSLIPITGGMIEGLDGIAVIRGVRLVRLVRAVRVARIVATTPRFRRTLRYARRVVRRSQVGAIGLTAAMVMGLGAAAIFAAEAAVNAQVRHFGDAAWWAFRSFLTGGFTPVTGVGRILVALLQLTGLVLGGVFVASLTNAIVKEPNAEEVDESLEAPADERLPGA